MDLGLVALAATISYLVGSVSFTRIISRRLRPDLDVAGVTIVDPQTGQTYSRPPSATAASMALGWRAGCLISLLDMGKAAVPMLIWLRFYPQAHYHLVAAVAAVVGNNWPVFFRFAGGSGLSTIYGGLLVIDPLGVLVTASGGFAIGMLLLRSMQLAFILPTLLLVPWLWYRTGDPAYVWYAVAVNLLYFTTFIKDARQYLAAEHRMSEREFMEQMPMGRGMLKMLAILGLKKR